MIIFTLYLFSFQCNKITIHTCVLTLFFAAVVNERKKTDLLVLHFFVALCLLVVFFFYRVHGILHMQIIWKRKNLLFSSDYSILLLNFLQNVMNTQNALRRETIYGFLMRKSVQCVTQGVIGKRKKSIFAMHIRRHICCCIWCCCCYSFYQIGNNSKHNMI